MLKKRSSKFTVFIIMLMLATMFTGVGPISATGETGDTELILPVISIDSEQFQQLGTVKINLDDVEIIPADGEAITIQLPSGCEFNGSIGEDAVKSGLIITYTNIFEISSQKVADNEVKLMISGNPGADEEGNDGSILIDFAAIKVTAGAGNIEANLLSSGAAFPEMTTAVIAAISDEISEPPAETGTDPDNPEGGDIPGDDTPDGDTPGDDTPGDDTSGDDNPSDVNPGDDTSGDDTSGDDTSGDDTSGDDNPDEILPPDSGDNPEQPQIIVPQTVNDPKQIFMTDLTQLYAKKAKLSNSQQKLETRLLQLLNEEFLPSGKSKNDLIREMQKEGQLSKESFITRSEEAILSAQAYVYIDLMPGSAISDLDSYVSEIVNSSSEYNMAVAWVEVSELEILAGLQDVKSIRLVDRPVCNTGTMLSQGDAVHRADLFRSTTGKDGTGIKIGIISDGVNSWTIARNSGNLPSNLHVLSDAVGGDEGTAMLEIVHDLAPGAELYFHDCGNNTQAFNEAITELAEAGCNIICDDIGWITQPFFEDGNIALHVATVIDDYNIIYVSSAGNAGQRHYQGSYVNDGTNFHNKSLYVNLPPGASIRAVLEWNDMFDSSGNDYDFYLWNADTGEILDYSYYAQNGSQSPLEFIDYTNSTGYALDGELTVLNYNGYASPKILEMYVYGANGAGVYTNNRIAADSIFGHAAVPEVISCGAVNASAPDIIEGFSSQGPVTMLSGTRQKPDIVGADGVSVTGAGGFSNPFYGTSAAAPHVAAIAALGWSQDINQTADQIRAKIMTGAVDLGSSGYDNIFGYGRADTVNAFPAPAINVKGYARYSNTVGDYSGITVTAKSGISVIDSTTTDITGLFELALPDGTYTLELTMPGYLKTLLQNISAASSLTEVSTVLVPIVMKAGDIDGSGLIDLSDLGLLADSYGSNSAQANYLQAADFDRSQLIDLSDLGYLADHYGESISEEPAALEIGTNNPADASRNQAYSGHTFTASGGTAPYSFAVISGSLPTNMNLSSAGYLSGTPTASGTFNFTVRVTDSKSATDSRAFSLTVSSGQKGWTIMLYSDGDNNLEQQLLEDIAEAKAGVTNDVNMIVLVDRIPGESSDSTVLGADFTDTRLYRITPGTATRIGGSTQFSQITTTSNYEANMGDANTLKKFIQFCKANYPANNYALILSNHGGGARSQSEVLIDPDISIENDVCWDDTNGGDCLYTAEISDVLSTNENIDLLAFDACLMGTAEVAYQYRPGNGSFAADVMVASAPNVWGYGLDYQAILARLNTNGGNNGQTDSTMGGSELNYNPATLTALQLGGVMVEEQHDSTAGYSNQSLACLDLSKIGAVKTALDALARDLYSKSERSDFESIRGSGSNPVTMKYFNSADEVEWIVVPYFDFYDLCKRVNSNTTKFGSTTRNYAAAVMTALDNTVVYSYGGSSYPNFINGQNGLSVFFPDGARAYSVSGTAMWAYQWWYNSIDTNVWWSPNPNAHLYGKLKWCNDGRYTSTNSVGNWFEMLDAWYDIWVNDTDGGCNGYQW